MKISKVIAEKKYSDIVISIALGATLREAAKKMMDNAVGALLILGDEDKDYKGLITKTDMVRAIADGNANPDTMKVGDFMTKHLIVANIHDDVEYVINVMVRHNISHLPIINGKSITAMVTKMDIMNSLNVEKDIELQWLGDYTGAAGAGEHQVF